MQQAVLSVIVYWPLNHTLSIPLLLKCLVLWSMVLWDLCFFRLPFLHGKKGPSLFGWQKGKTKKNLKINSKIKDTQRESPIGNADQYIYRCIYIRILRISLIFCGPVYTYVYIYTYMFWELLVFGASPTYFCVRVTYRECRPIHVYISMHFENFWFFCGPIYTHISNWRYYTCTIHIWIHICGYIYVDT